MKRFSALTLSQQFLLIAMGTILILLAGVSTYMVKTSVSSKVDQLQIMANGRSSAVIEKIDRNFYERFGDVQAFAFNKLAVQAAINRKTDAEVDRFINTMVSYYVLYDLMMITDIEGKVVSANTIDKYGKPLSSESLIGKDFSREKWFKSCISESGVKDAAWYSDFAKNEDVTSLYKRPGYGMAFAAVIKDNEGKPIGVWYNFANWEDVTSSIRKETEKLLQESCPGAFILITNERGTVIDCDDPSTLLKNKVSIASLSANEELEYHGSKISIGNYIAGEKQGTGAYTYKGKNWKAITFVPRPTVSMSYLKENLAGYFLTILLALTGVGFGFYKLASSISINLTTFKNIILSLSKGELVMVEDSKLKNEIGEMTSAIKSLVNGMRDTAQFANQIGEGNLNGNYNPLSANDVLGNALIRMRNNLVKIKENDQQREWATTGLARIAEILRSNYSTPTKLYDKLIHFVVNYTNSNQGAMFLVGDKLKEKELILVGCYAYGRKKVREKKVAFGEGLVGQCYLEQDIVYLTTVPSNYITITSGLGEATPTSVLLVPLKVNTSVIGVMELASFKTFEEHQRVFLKMIAESIGSTLSTIQVNEQTKRLLESSQQQAEEMKATEEELRQNMKELITIREEMTRKEKKYIKRIEQLETLVVVACPSQFANN